jgi:hypothetical protein
MSWEEEVSSQFTCTVWGLCPVGPEITLILVFSICITRRQHSAAPQMIRGIVTSKVMIPLLGTYPRDMKTHRNLNKDVYYSVINGSLMNG